MSRVRSWLTFLRIHTSNLTQVGAVLGPLLAGVTNVPLLVAYALWGLLYHAWGFTDNNIQDYLFDVQDPAKQHFALVRGDIPLPVAKAVNHALLAATVGVGVVFTFRSVTAFAFLLVSITSGLLYNRTCKSSLLAPLYIALAFTALPLCTYFSQTTAVTLPILFVAVFTTLLMLFQIAFEGYLKDLGADPVNLLRHWGARLYPYCVSVDNQINDLHEDKITMQLDLGHQWACWLLLKEAGLALAVIFTYATATVTVVEHVAALLILIFTILIVGVYVRMTEVRYDNKRVTAGAAKIEIMTYFVLILALARVIGVWTAVVLIVYPVAWFVVLNYATWRTLLRPKV